MRRLYLYWHKVDGLGQHVAKIKITATIHHKGGVTLSRNWSPMDTRICPLGRSFGNIWHAKHFPKGLPKGHIRVSIGVQSWDSVMPPEIFGMPKQFSKELPKGHTYPFVHLGSTSPKCEACIKMPTRTPWSAKFLYVCIHRGSTSGQGDTCIKLCS